MSVDVSAWLDSIGQAYQHEAKSDGAEVWHLHPCPFCGKNDAAKDSTIRRGADGKLGWHCFHDSCEGARLKAEAKEQGRKVSSWAILCDKLGYPTLDHVTRGTPGTPVPSASYPSWREREAARAAAQVPPLTFDTMSWDELKRADLRIEWLVPRAIVAGQPLMVGGASKSLKTSIIIDLMVSLAGAAQWLGAFAPPPEPVPCLLISGESGHYTIRDTIERVIAARGIVDQGLPLHIATVLPRLSVEEHIEKTKQEIQRTGARLFAIDPAYLALLSDTAGDANLFTVGTILRRFNEIAVETGATLCLLHHFRKATRAKSESFVKPTLEDFAYSGFAEWARQWLLLKRRSEFQPGSGHHDLYMEIGGSVGHCGQWALTIDEGQTDDPLEGRVWRTQMEKWSDEEHGNPTQAKRKQDTRSRVLAVLRQAPLPMNVNQIAKHVEGSSRSIQMALQALIGEGLVDVEYSGRSPVYRYLPRSVDEWDVLD